MAHIPFPPVLKIASIVPTADFPAQVNRSRWTGRSKVVLLSGAELWTFSVRFQPLTREADIRPVRAWFFAMKGMGNTTDLPVLQTRQYAAGSLGSASASGTGSTISVEGASIAGAYVTLTTTGGHKRLAVVGSDGSTISPAPDSAASGAVEVYNPVSRVRFADRSIAFPDEQGVVALSLGFEEAL